MNLLSDPWIPVLRDEGIANIKPYQICEAGVRRLAWDRADFNLACLELLIGLVSMVYPPRNEADWFKRFYEPDPDHLREALHPFQSHFELDGDGPRFMQDFEPFEQDAERKDIKPLDMLFIDSAGQATTSKNADLTVKRDRFPSLHPAQAAMALYTLQAYAPSGGSGNRTSMRGGGPMTTLIDPCVGEDTDSPLWRLIFANVLPGEPLGADCAKAVLPWLRPTKTSEKGQVTDQSHHDDGRIEVFFGMPRRLRLLFDNGQAIGVMQRPYGTNYTAWEHPLTPYYRKKEDDPEWLPVHPKAGPLSYRNWLGVTMVSSMSAKKTSRMARTVREYSNRPKSPDYELMVGGWAMDNMKPLDFSLHKYPGFHGLDDIGAERVHLLVEASIVASNALKKCLKKSCQLDGTAAHTVIESLFLETENTFQELVGRIMKGEGEQVEESWYRTLRNQVEKLFDERFVGGLADLGIATVEKRIIERRKLFAALNSQVRKALELERTPLTNKKEKPT